MPEKEVKTISTRVVDENSEEFEGDVTIVPEISATDLKEKIMEKLGSEISVPPSRLSIFRDGEELTGNIYQQVFEGDKISVCPYKTVTVKIVGKKSSGFSKDIKIHQKMRVRDVKEKIVEKLGSEISVPPSQLSILHKGKELTGNIYEQLSKGDEIEVSPKPDIATALKTPSFYFLEWRWKNGFFKKN